jgi:DNA modification methylase
MTYQILHGNNLDILPTLPDNSVDAIVTDPPYELGFMGKKWDSSGIAYNVELWRECLRVLKPGGHLLSFGGTRTWHRIAVAIEDAGFEVRDSIAWMYGSGFPKSLDVSKAIDKSTGENKQRQLKFVNWMRSTGMTAKEANAIVQKADIASHYFRLDQPAIATADLFDKLRPYLPEVPEEIERLVAERTGIEWTAYKNREVIGQQTQGKLAVAPGQDNDRSQVELEITSPATPEAQQWEGWGTALKPAFEPVIVARKPLIGTVAANVLEHGTGGLNIDGSRIGTTDNLNGGAYSDNREKSTNQVFGEYNRLSSADFAAPLGRWPANVILDEYTAGLLDEQSGQTASKAANRGLQVSGQAGGLAGSNPNYKDGTDSVRGHNDSGGASRFFYVAKASKRDRNEGLEELGSKVIEIGDERPSGNSWERRGKGQDTPRQNFHPTVKPTALMRYLVKLVTPPGGVVLDPFTGSGSTGKAAILEGFDFIGIELTDEYLPIIEGRLKHAEKLAAEEKEKKEEALF